MKKVLLLASEAYDKGEVPIAAIVESNGHIFSQSINSVETLTDPTAHAEILAISSACTFLGTRYLKSCTLYVNLEPCPMCINAALWAQIDKVVFGASDKRHGGINSCSCIRKPKLNVVAGVLESECMAIINKFFKRIRI